MDTPNSTSSGPKSAKRVIIRIDPVPNVKRSESKEASDYDYKEHARYVTPENEITAPPPKSALKTKRRGSLLVVNTPPPISRHVSISQSPDINHELEAIQQSHKEIESVREEEEAIPEHHRVLYELLGTEKAESILNPKIEEPTKKAEEKEEQKDVRKLPTVDTCLGADALWEILKTESDKKLFKMDKKIPTDWKLSYGAYVRNNISQNRALIERSFTDHADVPELDKLLDHRYRDRVLKARHHANVMFRSSENNKNRTALLLNNNPVPDYNDRDGHQRLERYFSGQELPSIEQKQKPLALPVPTTPKESPRESRPITSRQFPNLRFLNERDSRTKGKFYDKYSTSDTVKMVTDIPGYRVPLPPSMKERICISAPVHDFTALRSAIGHRRLFSPRSPIKRDPTWQPLTVGALMEYASTKIVLGSGEYRYGQPTRWRTQAATA